MRNNENVDRSIRDIYEHNPFDPVAGARIAGRLLGAIIAFDRKMNVLVLLGSIIVGGMYFVSGMMTKHPFNLIVGSLILLNVLRNLLRYYLKVI